MIKRVDRPELIWFLVRYRLANSPTWSVARVQALWPDKALSGVMTSVLPAQIAETAVRPERPLDEFFSEWD